MVSYIVLDTETADTVKHSDNNAHPETSLVYDFGYIVCSSKGEELARHSFAISETFANVNLMNNAYYAEKLPQYYAGMRNGSWQTVSWVDAYNQFRKDCKTFNVKTVWAFNARFDRVALNHTTETYSNGFVKWFVPYGIKWGDVWDYASMVTGTRRYVVWARDHGYTTPKGNPMTNAECVYRYLTNDPTFTEAHTALDDATRELFIYQWCKRQHRKTRHSIGQGWRDAAKVSKTL